MVPRQSVVAQQQFGNHLWLFCLFVVRVVPGRFHRLEDLNPGLFERVVLDLDDVLLGQDPGGRVQIADGDNRLLRVLLV